MFVGDNAIQEKVKTIRVDFSWIEVLWYGGIGEVVR